MTIECPACGSLDLRFSRLRDFRERLQSLVGICPLRCRNCQARFVRRTWSLTQLRFARCPRCLRTDLSRWNPEDYWAPAGTRIALALGAQPLRCEYCRLNFSSFRRRRERFGERKRKPVAAQNKNGSK